MRIKVLFLLLCIATLSFAQIPYFGTTTGKGSLYTYLQLKAFPGNNNQSSYTSVNYGLGNNFDIAGNYNSADNTNSWGLKYSFFNKDWMHVGLQSMVGFDLKKNYHFNNATTGLYLNGYVAPNISYILNTWYTQYEKSSWWEQWYYLGYDIGKVTILAGGVTELSNECKSDLALGMWTPINKHGSNIYLWLGNLLQDHSDLKVTIGFDYKF